MRSIALSRPKSLVETLGLALVLFGLVTNLASCRDKVKPLRRNQCETDRDCLPRYECMSWVGGQKRKTCELVCLESAECPSGTGCGSAHDSGPHSRTGSQFCIKRDAEPWLDE